jgi:hypothetical protein
MQLTDLERDILQRLQTMGRSHDELVQDLFAYYERAHKDPPGGEPTFRHWDTGVPVDLPSGAQEGQWGQMTWGQETWWPGVTTPHLMKPDQPELNGLWYGYQGVTPWGDWGTLWHANAYNVYGTIDGLELWEIGDFVKGREGHGLYLRCVPHLDTTIRRCTFRKLGGQAVQREWRTTETDIPASVWGDFGGYFTIEDCDFRETGMIDTGSAVRASWAMALSNTGQQTIIRRVTHTNYHSMGPHEGSLFVGYGQAGFRGPNLLVEECDFRSRAGDRAAIFVQAVDDTTICRTKLQGLRPYIDVVDDCRQVTVFDMPQDTLVRVKRRDQPHNAPKETYIVKAGETLVRTFQE